MGLRASKQYAVEDDAELDLSRSARVAMSASLIYGWLSSLSGEESLYCIVRSSEEEDDADSVMEYELQRFNSEDDFEPQEAWPLAGCVVQRMNDPPNAVKILTGRMFTFPHGTENKRPALQATLLILCENATQQSDWLRVTALASVARQLSATGSLPIPALPVEPDELSSRSRASRRSTRSKRK